MAIHGRETPHSRRKSLDSNLIYAYQAIYQTYGCGYWKQIVITFALLLAPHPGGPAGEVTRPVEASWLVRRPVGPLIFVLCVPVSQEQKSGIFPRDLTTRERLPMMAKSSARRRHGPARDVLRTNVPVAGQPSQRVGWGATARAGGGLPAAVADPVGPRAGSSARCEQSTASCSRIGGVTHVSGLRGSTLTASRRSATITLGPRSGTVSDWHTVWSGRSKPYVPSNRIEGGGVKTSQEPNGRTREEGSDRGHPPPRGRTSCGVALVCLASQHWARAACVV